MQKCTSSIDIGINRNKITVDNIKKNKKNKKVIKDKKISRAETRIDENYIIKFNSKFGLIKLIFYMIFFIVMNSCKIFGNINPCIYSVYLTFLFLGQSSFYTGLSYLIGGIVCGFNTNLILFSIITCAIYSVVVFIHRKRKIKISTYLMFLYGFCAGLFYLMFSIRSLEYFYLSVVEIFLNCLFILCSGSFLKILNNRKLNFNLNKDEILCGCVIVALFFCGLQNLNYFAFDFVKLIGTFFVLFLSCVFPTSAVLSVSIISGLGCCLSGGNFSYIVLFSCVGVFVGAFKEQSKILNVLNCIIIDVVLSLFFNLFNLPLYLTILPTVISSLAFLLIPQNVFLKVKSTLFLEKENNSLKNILNQNKLSISKKLAYTAEVFYEMDKNFRKYVKGSIDIKTAKKMLCSELIRSNCENCINKNRCLKGFNSELKSVLEKLINVGFEKGKITLVDLPAYLSNRCSKLNSLIVNINTLINEYKNHTNTISNSDSSKLLIADQLGGISNILLKLSAETKQIINLDQAVESKIKEELTYVDIIPSEVVCFEEDEKTNVVSLVIRSIDYDNKKIVEVLNKVCKCKMKIEEIIPNIENNLVYLNYKTAPIYNISFGIAQSSKGGEDVCGDTHSIMKINDNKFMIAICDGMGHGEEANKVSELSISMVENFYRAGYDNQTILTSVNSLMNLDKKDVFSTVDISVIDLKSGETDFIKQGAVNGYIKTKKDLYEIKSNSLPLGILDSVEPKISKTILESDDMLIMLSDGVVDAFSSEDELKSFVYSEKTKNPQELADSILNIAKRKQNNYPKDDMTVLVGKIFLATA